MTVDIILNVYHLGASQDQPLSFQQQQLSSLGLGIYHSGIEIQGTEYSYGGNANNPGTGVFTSVPLQVDNAQYFCSFNIGTCSDIAKVFSTLESVKQQFKANEYSMISRNCNHFSNAFTTQLLGKSIPRFVNRIAQLGSWWVFLLPQSLKSLNPVPQGEPSQMQMKESVFTGTPVSIV